VLVARDNINVYSEDFSDSGRMPVFTTLKAGTVIADQFSDEGEYYRLVTGHDCLFVKKSDVVVNKKL
jgi:hypothetical protein